MTQWYQEFIAADIAHRSTILRDNGTALVLDTSFSLQVLELHQKLVAFPARKWIPLLPGYTIYTKLNNHYFQLKINTNTHFLVFWWAYYKNDKTFTHIINSGQDCSLFKSLYTNYPELKNHSFPWLLGFFDSNNVAVLQSTVNEIYPNLFSINSDLKIAYENEQTFKRSLKRKAIELEQNKENENSNLQIKNRVIIINGRKTLSSQYEQALIVKYNEKVEQIYNKNRVISRLEKKLAQLQTKLNSIDSSTNLAQFEDKNNDNTLELKVTQQMEQLQLGSMILVDTKEYNELPNLSYSSLVAAGGLMSGLNRHSLQSALGCLGITSQISKPTYHKYQMQLFLPLIQCAQLSVNNALIKACQFALFKPQIPGIEPILAIGFDYYKFNNIYK
ncbi:545_t:CDS:2 [Gigaspora rosea]|nr:545_t:CDS:2 [Gigaspora rosea]